MVKLMKHLPRRDGEGRAVAVELGRPLEDGTQLLTDSLTMIRTRMFVVLHFLLFASNLNVDVTFRDGRRFASILFDEQVVGQTE